MFRALDIAHQTDEVPSPTVRDRERARAAREKTKATETKSKTRSLLRPPKVPQNTWQIFLEEYITVSRLVSCGHRTRPGREETIPV